MFFFYFDPLLFFFSCSRSNITIESVFSLYLLLSIIWWIYLILNVNLFVLLWIQLADSFFIIAIFFAIFILNERCSNAYTHTRIYPISDKTSQREWNEFMLLVQQQFKSIKIFNKTTKKFQSFTEITAAAAAAIAATTVAQKSNEKNLR